MPETPLRRQYLDIKRRYPHAILFFRLGDFYETFDEDAELVARELGITLTSRPIAKGQRVPLAGIPHHALDSYLGKLIGKGYKVAICEQMEQPGKGKKLVDREVVRVVTPGTVIEDNLLDRSANNYLAALQPGDGQCGLAYVDVSTGDFSCTEIEATSVIAELERLQPAELLLPQGYAPAGELTATLTPLPPEKFEQRVTAERLLEHFAVDSLEPLGLTGMTLAATASGALLLYLDQNHPAALAHIARISSGRLEFMSLDANTRRNLELCEPLRPDHPSSTLLSVLDRTGTAVGARLLRKWIGQPLIDIIDIEARLDAVQFFVSSATRRGRVSELMSRTPDMERAFARISAAVATSPTATTVRDLIALRRGLEVAPTLRNVIIGDPEQEIPAGSVEDMLLTGLHPCSEAVDLISRAISEDPKEVDAINAGFSDELDGLRAASRETRQYIADIEQRERERTGIKSLKVGYNRVFGYYIEISKANSQSVPPDYQRKQTLVGGERYTTPELQEHEYRMLHAQERQQELEQSLLRQVCAQVAAEGGRILETARAIAAIDVYCALAEAAARYAYVRPEVNNGDEILVRDGRHPVVERMLPASTFVPNDIHLLTSDAQIIVLTGPNMAGKSTYLRQTALIVLMAQMGSFVPATEARIGVVDRLFSRIGAMDDIATGRSTFMVEMLETAAILHRATRRSLLIFDEIGRGTSTYDGVAIARAVVEFIHNRPDAAAKTLFATHYHELIELASVLPRVRNFNVAVAEEQGRVVFLHRILPGGADRSYGVHVAQLAGLPKAVIARAQEILIELEVPRGVQSVAGPSGESSPQLPLFAHDNRLRSELASLDIDAMTPLQALNRLYELVGRARAAESG